MISALLTDEFDSLKNAGFLLNCLPNPVSKWAESTVKNAKLTGIVPWGTSGLNTLDITRYDAALILTPFLYNYMGEDKLLKSAGIKEKLYADYIPQTFVYDLADGEDIYLLNKLGIMILENGRFNPTGKIQRQSAAIIFTKTAQLFGLNDAAKSELKCADLSKISDWANAYVKFAVSLKIMGVDDKNNFNPEKYITYQEFYNSLLNICRLKEANDKKSNINLPKPQYFQELGQGTTIASNGWIYYYQCDLWEEFTGKGREVFENGEAVYEGDFVNGLWNGFGRIDWRDGSIFEGEFREGEITGNGKMIYQNGDIYEGGWLNGMWNGTGKITFINGDICEGEFKNGEYWNAAIMRNGEVYIKWIDGIQS
jgi:hypothetical protein